jgi:hypothetical protein
MLFFPIVFSLLSFDPAKRLSANQCLVHTFLRGAPSYDPVTSYPAPVTIPYHEFEHEQWKPNVEKYREEMVKEGSLVYRSIPYYHIYRNYFIYSLRI